MYKLTPKISYADSLQLDAGGLTGPKALSYSPITGDFSLLDTSGADFIHSMIVYVDPNGDDSTGQFGNANLPFKTPVAAMFASADYMSTNYPNIAQFNFVDAYEFVGATTTNYYLGEDNVFITIEVNPGVYNVDDDIAWLAAVKSIFTLEVNLFFNYIAWNLLPGAIMLEYIFNDSYNHVNAEVNLPGQCIVRGDGSWFSDAEVTSILLTVDKTRFDFTAYHSSLLFYITAEAKLNYTVDFQYKAALGGTELTAGLEKGEVNMKIADYRWRVTETTNFSSTIYQGGGKLDLWIGNYYSTLADTADEAEFLKAITPLFGGTGASGSAWSFNFYNDNRHDTAPPLGYWEELDSNFPTTANIRVDNAKFYAEILQVEGGRVNFYPGNIDVTLNGLSEVAISTPFSIGGPYFSGSVSKFSMYGGKINMIGDPTRITNSIGFTVYDDPQIYIKDTLLKWDDMGRTTGIYYYNLPVSTFQVGSIILDGPKFFTESIGASAEAAKFVFYMNALSNIDVKIYANVFSNFNPVGATNGTYTNLIPGTALIIDSNVQII